MKRRLSLCLVLLLAVCLSAFADGVPALSDALFDQAKEVLTRLSYGDYESIPGLLSWSGEAPGAAAWEALAGRFHTLDNGTVQREVSVAFWWDEGWHIAVPVMPPSSDQVEALVLTSADGQRFNSAARAQWGRVSSAYEGSDQVFWNEEYLGGVPIIVGDD